MLRSVVTLVALLGGPAFGEGFASDAFGILPARALGPDRAAWADVTRPLPAAAPTGDRIALYAGPKSLVAGQEAGHGTALVLDGFGNLVPDGQIVTFHIGEEGRDEARTLGGIAAVPLPAPPTPGALYVSASTDRVQSARALIRAVPDLDALQPRLGGMPGPLVPETLAALQTGRIQDPTGGTVPDGLVGRFQLAHEDGSVTIADGVTQGGVVRSGLIVRDISTGGQLSFALGSRIVGGDAVAFAPLSALSNVPVRLSPLPRIGGVDLAVGPFRTTGGHLLGDGAPIGIVVTGPGGVRASRSGWLRDGVFSDWLALPPEGGPYRVEVTSPLGHVVRNGVAVERAP